MPANLTLLVHIALVEPRIEPSPQLFESCILLPIILRCHAVDLRKKHCSANVCERVPRERAQSGMYGRGKMLNEREGFFVDVACGSLESVELVFAALHLFTLLLVFENIKASSCAP